MTNCPSKEDLMNNKYVVVKLTDNWSKNHLLKEVVKERLNDLPEAEVSGGILDTHSRVMIPVADGADFEINVNASKEQLRELLLECIEELGLIKYEVKTDRNGATVTAHLSILVEGKDAEQ